MCLRGEARGAMREAGTLAGSGRRAHRTGIAIMLVRDAAMREARGGDFWPAPRRRAQGPASRSCKPAMRDARATAWHGLWDMSQTKLGLHLGHVPNPKPTSLGRKTFFWTEIITFYDPSRCSPLLLHERTHPARHSAPPRPYPHGGGRQRPGRVRRPHGSALL